MDKAEKYVYIANVMIYFFLIWYVPCTFKTNQYKNSSYTWVDACIFGQTKHKSPCTIV